MSAANKWLEELNFLVEIVAPLPLKREKKWGIPVYTFDGKNVLGFAGFKSHIAIWFYNGVFLKDKGQLLINAQEGKTKALRQLRFTSIEEINETIVKAYALEAIEVEKKGLKVEVEKALIKPDQLLEEAFSNTQLSDAFAQLTPGRQKEYLSYIKEAKQEATKLKRLEKITPMILAGKGLNDKYK